MHRYANQLQIDSRGGEHRLLTLHQAISSYSNDIKGYNNHTLVSLCQLFNRGKAIVHFKRKQQSKPDQIILKWIVRLRGFSTYLILEQTLIANSSPDCTQGPILKGKKQSVSIIKIQIRQSNWKFGFFLKRATMQGGGRDRARASLLGFSCPQKQTVEKISDQCCLGYNPGALRQTKYPLRMGWTWGKNYYGALGKRNFSSCLLLFCIYSSQHSWHGPWDWLLRSVKLFGVVKTATFEVITENEKLLAVSGQGLCSLRAL